MGLITITNLGGSIRIYDTRFAPQVTDVNVLKDGLQISRFGDVVRIAFIEGNWIDVVYSEVELFTFTSSIIPSDSLEFYDELWNILQDYCGCSTDVVTECTRLLEDDTPRMLEDSEYRSLELCEDASSLFVKLDQATPQTIINGNVSVNDPISAQHIATKAYVDSDADLTNIYVTFDSGAALTYLITVDIDTIGTYSLSSFVAPMTSATYKKNAVTAALPITLTIGDTLLITPDDYGKLKLSGKI